MAPKTPSESKTTQTEIVLPNDTNNLNNLMGGRLLHWMDIVAAVTAQRHSERTCVIKLQLIMYHLAIRSHEKVLLL